MTEAAPFEVSEKDGVLSGPLRRPVNVSRDAAGSIHDDATAQKLGFRGGTVAGNIHMEQLPPLYAALFGRPWTEPGGLSLYFLNATTHGDPVRAMGGPVEAAGPNLRRAPVWMETPEGVRVCEGSAWSGAEDPGSALRLRLAAARPPGELRILAGVKVGDEVRDVPARLDGPTCLERVKGVTEPMPCYVRPDSAGRLTAAPAVAIDALRAVEGPLFRAQGDFVGLFGAIELQHVGGPVFLDRDYLADGSVVALGDSPKTEVVWYESRLRDAADGRLVARLLMMSRVMKGSSPLWADS